MVSGNAGESVDSARLSGAAPKWMMLFWCRMTFSTGS
ncbi:MAG: hypothetical protein ACI8QZ_003692, partial [Chlamydiales bacterium]